MTQTKPMSEPMTDEAIIEHLKHRLFIDCAELLREALRLAREPQWVSVEDRLPEVVEDVSEDVLCLLSATESDEPLNRVCFYTEDDTWEDSKGYRHEVTHWMYLPAPPKPPQQ